MGSLEVDVAVVAQSGLWRSLLTAVLVAACGTSLPAPTPIVLPTDSPAATRAPSGSASASPSAPESTPTLQPTPAPSGTNTPSPSATTEPTNSPTPSATIQPTPPYAISGCHRSTDASSIARYWDEQALDLVRVNPPAPTVVARNLFDLSAVMWDAWAAYDPTAVGYFFNEKQTAVDVTAARNAAISYAAFRLLVERYNGIQPADFNEAYISPEFAIVMQAACYWPGYDDVNGSSPASLGIRIATEAIDTAMTDGSLEGYGYVDDSFAPANDPLRPDKSGTSMKDPNLWQPLAFPPGKAQGQGGRPAPDVQTFVAAQWGHVKPFALDVNDDGVAIDPGRPPALGSDAALDAEFKQAAIDVLTYSSTLDTGDGVTEDISPASLGNDDLGTNDGHGRALNPITGAPYQPDVVMRADYERALAEYWADGPTSETPPGHWNLLANAAADASPELRFEGITAPSDRLEWDVKMYFALNGALHDAAIAAWGLKRHYDTARPISMIRYMCGRGQSSDPSLPHYNPEGIPLVDGLVELVTKESSAPGERHAKLRGHIGEVAVKAWRGFPDDPTKQTSGVGWILGVDWVPYQRAGFVTPAFPGYVSGHSTYSRAAAEVLTALTGSEYFPGGVYTYTVDALKHEVGPTRPVTLEWATYFDAADAAGMSRQYMGIHIPEDDFAGRKIGSTIGKDAWSLATKYFDGSVPAKQS